MNQDQIINKLIGYINETSFKKNPEPILFKAINDNNIEIVKLIIKDYEENNCNIVDIITSMYEYFGYYDDDVDDYFDYNESPFIIAIKSRNEEIINLFIEKIEESKFEIYFKDLCEIILALVNFNIDENKNEKNENILKKMLTFLKEKIGFYEHDDSSNPLLQIIEHDKMNMFDIIYEHYQIFNDRVKLRILNFCVKHNRINFFKKFIELGFDSMIF